MGSIRAAGLGGILAAQVGKAAMTVIGLEIGSHLGLAQPAVLG